MADGNNSPIHKQPLDTPDASRGNDAIENERMESSRRSHSDAYNNPGRTDQLALPSNSSSAPRPDVQSPGQPIRPVPIDSGAIQPQGASAGGESARLTNSGREADNSGSPRGSGEAQPSFNQAPAMVYRPDKPADLPSSISNHATDGSPTTPPQLSNPSQSLFSQSPSRTDATDPFATSGPRTQGAVPSEAWQQNLQDYQQPVIAPIAAESSSSSPSHTDSFSPPPPSPTLRTSQELISAGDRLQQPQAVAGGQERSQPSWYQMRDQVATQTVTEAQALSQSQRPSAVSGTAVADRLSQDQGPDSRTLPSSDLPWTEQTLNGRMSADKPQAGRSVASTGSGTGTGIDPWLEGQTAGTKALGGRQSAWSDNIAGATRPGEIKPSDGKIADCGLPPDGREHPLGTAGRMPDGRVNGSNGPAVGGRTGDVPAQNTGRVPDDLSGDGSAGIAGPIFDGHGGWKGPTIKGPFGDKSGAKTEDVGGDQTTGNRGQKIGSRQTPAGGRTPAESLIAIIENVKGGLRLGQFGRQEPSGKLDQSDKPDLVGKPDRSEKSDFAGKSDQSGKAELVGRQEPSAKLDQSGRPDPADRSDRSGKSDRSIQPVKPDKQATSGAELTLVDVRTKPWPNTKDGTPNTTVEMLTPFLSGLNTGLRVTKDMVTRPNMTAATGAKPGALGAGPVKSTDGGKKVGGDSFGVPLPGPKFVGDTPDRMVEAGRLKTRPSIKMHLPGDSYGTGREQPNDRPGPKVEIGAEIKPEYKAGSKPESGVEAKSETRSDTKAETKSELKADSKAATNAGNKIEITGIKPMAQGDSGRSWRIAGRETIIDYSKTVGDLPARAPAKAKDTHRPAKAIDESEITLEMESKTKSMPSEANGRLTPNATARYRELDKDRLGEQAKGRPGELTNNQANVIGSDPIKDQVNNLRIELTSEQVLDRYKDQTKDRTGDQLQKNDPYKYVVQEGDTVESVARAVLLDPMLAALLYSLNRQFVLLEEQYGVHPLRVGAVIQLPTPRDINNFRQNQ